MSGFAASPNCPFCREAGRVLFSLRYDQTAERNETVEDCEGAIRQCDSCGVAYPDIAFDLATFDKLYAKSLDDLTFFDDSILQRIRRGALTGVIRRQWPDPISKALQIPLGGRPRKVLDVGCGFGEFAKAYQALGAEVIATEVIPALVERNRKVGINCRLGDLTEIDLTDRFDFILFRAVLYRTGDPAATITKALDLLAPGGVISLIDPCVDDEGIRYFAFKQFPQGRFYITDFDAYRQMLAARFGLTVARWRQIYGRPNAPLKKVRMWGNIMGFGELAMNNLLGRKPYMMAYLTRPVSPP